MCCPDSGLEETHRIAFVIKSGLAIGVVETVMKQAGGGNQIPASVAKAQMPQTTPTSRPTLNSPCSKGRNTCVIDRRESQSSSPGCPASAKSRTHDPIVKARVMMAAVAALRRAMPVRKDRFHPGLTFTQIPTTLKAVVSLRPLLGIWIFPKP
jgi:hypothetical protein